jgi:hypothetical protein
VSEQNFCFWLWGLFELQGVKPGQALTAEQTDMVREHLALVFNKVTGAPPQTPAPSVNPLTVPYYPYWQDTPPGVTPGLKLPRVVCGPVSPPPSPFPYTPSAWPTGGLARCAASGPRVYDNNEADLPPVGPKTDAMEAASPAAGGRVPRPSC